MENQPAISLLVYANDRVDPTQHLRNLPVEMTRIRDALKPAELAGHCEVLVEANASAERIFSVFQDARYRNRIAILHYAGHANGDQLLLESVTGAPGIAHAPGLVAFLGEQRGLELVFWNGCSTAKQVQGLLDAKCRVAVATSQVIDDQVAMDLAVQFYEGLGGGAALESAFNAAVAAFNTQRGDDMRAPCWRRATEVATLAERAPWEFWFKPGADRAQHWNLPDAAGDPLFALPELPRLDLPRSPLRYLDWFELEHAEVLFGLVYQIRELYDRVTAADAPPILLFYSQTGVGKSSALPARLLPRLESSHRVRYLRRDPNLGLLGTLVGGSGASETRPAPRTRGTVPDCTHFQYWTVSNCQFAEGVQPPTDDPL